MRPANSTNPELRSLPNNSTTSSPLAAGWPSQLPERWGPAWGGWVSKPAPPTWPEAVAAVGQSLLVEAYERCLWTHGHHAQILLTAEDLDHRLRYLNARNTILALMEIGTVPIINENDTVSVEELETTFGDNDRLAALVTNLIQAPLLVLLSDVDGLFDGRPTDPASRKLGTRSNQIDDSITSLVRDRTGGLSKGGMASKLNAARIATASGENVIIASGRSPDVLDRILAGEPGGTLFHRPRAGPGRPQALDRLHRQAARQPGPRSRAASAVESNGRSLLAAGVVDVLGEFQKGDIVALCDQSGHGAGPRAVELRRRRRPPHPRPEDAGHRRHPGPVPSTTTVVHRDNMVLTG